MAGQGELRLVHASLATVAQLFGYKAAGFRLPEFPGYTVDQWGIKAHNRPWIEENGRWARGQRVVEVGGAYSRLPEYLGTIHGVEPWVADDFGMGTDEEGMWSRWGDPRELPGKHPSVRYVFSRLGTFSEDLPTGTFDRVFSVSTLEHIPLEHRPRVLADMHRLLAPRGLQLHTIDIRILAPRDYGWLWLTDRYRALRRFEHRSDHDIPRWIRLFRESGVEIDARVPRTLDLLDRSILVESPDVVYRFYPPNDAPKRYAPAASLLLVIERA